MKNKTPKPRTVRTIAGSGDHRGGHNRQSLVFKAGGIMLRTDNSRNPSPNFRRLTLAESFRIYRKLEMGLSGGGGHVAHLSRYLKIVEAFLKWADHKVLGGRPIDTSNPQMLRGHGLDCLACETSIAREKARKS